MVDMVQVAAVLSFFTSQQAKYGYKESDNLIQLKWDLRGIIEQIDNQKHLLKLIKFFMLLSDDRSLRYFINTYHEYNDSMIQTIADRALVKSLLKRTAKGVE